ncbi:unnamed protein product, partial [Phaeothamnion confervicola]
RGRQRTFLPCWALQRGAAPPSRRRRQRRRRIRRRQQRPTLLDRTRITMFRFQTWTSSGPSRNRHGSWNYNRSSVGKREMGHISFLIRVVLLLLALTEAFAFAGSGRGGRWQTPSLFSTSNAVNTPLEEHFLDESAQRWVRLILDSYRRHYGVDLLPREGLNSRQQAEAAAKANLCIIAHDFIRSKEDPVYCYGNKFCLKCFRYPWEQEFVQLPSRLCVADTAALAERQAFLDVARAKDKAASAGGIRVAKDGSQFYIRNLQLWNLVDGDSGAVIGQAAAYAEYEPL